MGKRRRTLVRAMLSLALALCAAAARAELTIEITEGVEGALPVAAVPFASPEPVPVDVAAVISANLARSGRFEALSPLDYLDRPSSFAEVNIPNWRALQVDYVVVGEVLPGATGPDGYQVRFQLVDVFQSERLLAFEFDVAAAGLRRIAHHISDLIYQRLTGARGAFETLMVYVSATEAADGGRSYRLIVADSDGGSPRVVLSSEVPIMSPAWSPDARRLAYVSFEGRKSQIVVQDLYGGERFVVASYPGINGAPAWSPDGGQLAFTLSKDGNPEVYLYRLAGSSLVRLTRNTAIDTEPSWSPDGGTIVFTSDRGGGPQLYRIGLAGGRPERISFEGDYNARPVYSPDGTKLAYVHRRAGAFYIALMDLATGGVRLLSSGGLDESPSFAPNGRMIAFSTKQGARSILASVAVDGRAEYSLLVDESDVRDPAWSPFLR